MAKHTGSHYLLTQLPAWELFPAVIRGKVRQNKSKSTNPVAVGDLVVCEVPDDMAAISADNPATITKILPRRNYVVRKSTNLSRDAHVIAANVDRAFVVITLAFPEVKLPFLDRILVTCEVYGIPVTIVLNKIDLLREASSRPSGVADVLSETVLPPWPQGEGPKLEECADRACLSTLSPQAWEGLSQKVSLPEAGREEADAIAEMIDAFKAIYQEAGYRVIETSAKTGEGIEELRAAMAQSGVNLLSGVSGVGKSSLIKALDPSLDPRTGQISLAHLQGKHTTTFYEMYPLCSGGYIIDTPGIRSFGLVDLEPQEVSKYFPEMLQASQGCRFTPCTHTHEPGCAVKGAVDSGQISAERYNSYLGMLEEYNKYRK